MIKYAWSCDHEDYGEILSFIVSPQINTYANTYATENGLTLDEAKVKLKEK